MSGRSPLYASIMCKPFIALGGALAGFFLLTNAAHSSAQTQTQRPPDTTKNRLLLADTLGAMHYLSSVCSGLLEQTWRDRMVELLQVEQISARMQDNLIAAFNHGFRLQEQYYPSCTPNTVGRINAQKRLKSEQGRLLAVALADPYLH